MLPRSPRAEFGLLFLDVSLLTWCKDFFSLSIFLNLCSLCFSLYFWLYLLLLKTGFLHVPRRTAMKIPGPHAHCFQPEHREPFHIAPAETSNWVKFLSLWLGGAVGCRQAAENCDWRLDHNNSGIQRYFPQKTKRRNKGHSRHTDISPVQYSF